MANITKWASGIPVPTLARAASLAVAGVTRQLRLPPEGTRWLSLLSGIAAAAATISYFLATHRALLTVTAVITSLYPAGIILLARVLLGEKLTAVRLAGPLPGRIVGQPDHRCRS